VRSVPGVVDVAVANQLPLGGNVDMYGIRDPDNTLANPELAPNADRYSVSSGFFKAMRLPLLRGETFTDVQARDTSNLVAMVSEGLAAAMWPGQDAIGRRIRIGGATGRDRRVIGIVGNVKHHGLDTGMPRQFY